MYSTKCPYCNQVYSRKDAMLRHQRQKHSGTQEAIQAYPRDCEAYPLPQRAYPPQPQQQEFVFQYPFTANISGPTGELTIDCKDPDNKHVPVHTTDNFDGTYKLKVRPVKPGTHILNIRINGHHVFGSPFAITVAHPRPRSPVIIKVYGPGLKSGVFPDYQGHFYVDATGAGGGDLQVSVMGLKGAFHVEMQRASQKDKLFNCLYHPLEPGLYTINVQWSGNHVYGSPYKVYVAGSEMERLEYESQSKLDRSRESHDSEGKLDISRASSGKSSSKRSPNTTSNSFVY